MTLDESMEKGYPDRSHDGHLVNQYSFSRACSYTLIHIHIHILVRYSLIMIEIHMYLPIPCIRLL